MLAHNHHSRKLEREPGGISYHRVILQYSARAECRPSVVFLTLASGCDRCQWSIRFRDSNPIGGPCTSTAAFTIYHPPILSPGRGVHTTQVHTVLRAAKAVWRSLSSYILWYLIPCFLGERLPPICYTASRVTISDGVCFQIRGLTPLSRS